MKPLTTSVLDNMKCATPGCTCGSHDSEMWIHAKCHPGASLEACYQYATGNLDLICAECKNLVISIAVSGSEEKVDPWDDD